MSPLVKSQATQTGLLVNPIMLAVVRIAHISDLDSRTCGSINNAISPKMRFFVMEITPFMHSVNLKVRQY